MKWRKSGQLKRMTSNAVGGQGEGGQPRGEESGEGRVEWVETSVRGDE